MARKRLCWRCTECTALVGAATYTCISCGSPRPSHARILEINTNPSGSRDWDRVALGLGVAVIAGVISVVTYLAASEGGSSYYVVFWGAVLWGLWLAARGIAGSK